MYNPKSSNQGGSIGRLLVYLYRALLGSFEILALSKSAGYCQTSFSRL
jgi:hypothetical protein